MPRLPKIIEQFVAQQPTRPANELWKEGPSDYRSAYGSYWYRAVAGMLLSGRIAAKANSDPNLTDVHRLCKEANFNQYLLERIAKLFLRATVITATRQGAYVKGPGFAAWWDHDVEQLRKMTRHALLELVQEGTGYQPWRPTTIHHSHLIEFLQLFFACFQDHAFAEASAGQVLEAFSRLPEEELLKAAKACRIKVNATDVPGWKYWLDEKGQKAVLTALSITEWHWYSEQHQTVWLLLSPLGAGMLGLKEMPPPPELYADLKVLPNHSILAGAGRDLDSLVPLFRFCKIQRIDQVYEFQLDPRQLAEIPAGRAPAQELRTVLEEAGPLPTTVEDTLGTKPMASGTVRLRWCSALLQPESAEVLEAIKHHPRLKGYLEPGAPKGYLLLKPRSSPANFVQRCQELGFRVTTE